MSSPKLSLRLPQHAHDELRRIACESGYGSACQLARCVLIQFLRNRERVAHVSTEHSGWMQAMADEHEGADRDDPRCRRMINERL